MGRVTGERDELLRQLIDVEGAESSRYVGARNEKHFQRLFAVIRAYLDDLHSGRFLFRPGLGCTTCDFRTVCSERD